LERFSALDKKKLECAQANGNTNVSDDDVVEVNVGGKKLARCACHS
jgi:hypothetical protein